MWFWSWWGFSQNDLPHKMLEVKTPEYTWFNYLAWWNQNNVSGYEIWYPISSDYVHVDQNCFEKYEKTIKVPEKITKHKYEIYDWDKSLQETHRNTVKWIKQIFPEIEVNNIDTRKTDILNSNRKLMLDYKSTLTSDTNDMINISYDEAMLLESYTWELKCNISIFHILFWVKSKLKKCILN